MGRRAGGDGVGRASSRASVNGTTVAVKVGLGQQRRFSGGVDAMYRRAVLLKAFKMDAGLDLPSVVAAYRELVKDEFDFKGRLSQKLDRFSRLIQSDAGSAVEYDAGAAAPSV